MTVVPIILSSDQTQLTQFRNKVVYPVYITIGNIPKERRRKPLQRGHILIAYIPTTKLEGLHSDAAQRRAQANLFHSCLRIVLALIASLGETGVAMVSRDGIWHRCHPIFTTYVGDYPEQVLVTCTYRGQCPKCQVPHDQLGDFLRFPPRNYNETLELYQLADGEACLFHSACRKATMKPIFHPFWEVLPLSNVFVSITPNILHQVLQGVIKYIVVWLTKAFGTKQIDAHC